MDLIKSLDSINKTKVNGIRTADDPTTAAKSYPRFPVARSLSYHADALHLVNELNLRGLSAHEVSNIQHYEFLLYVLQKGKRFAKWERPENQADIELIAKTFSYTYERAKEILPLFTREQLNEMKSAMETGGIKKK